MVVDAAPCELMAQEVSLSNIEREKIVPQLTQAQAKNQIRQIVWRDKLNLHIGMDCVTLLDKLSKFFEEVHSFELDPHTKKPMANAEQFAVRMLVDRALNWLIT